MHHFVAGSRNVTVASAHSLVSLSPYRFLVAGASAENVEQYVEIDHDLFHGLYRLIAFRSGSATSESMP